MSIKPIVSVAVVLGLACVQAQAGPKRQLDSQDEPRSLYHRDDMKSNSRDVQAVDRLRKEEEAEQDKDGNAWMYDFLVMHHARGYSYVKPTKYGPYPDRETCEARRVERENRMEADPGDPLAPVVSPIRERHIPKNAPTITTTVSTGNQTSTTQSLGGPTETMLPKPCYPVTVRDLAPRTRRAERQ